MRSGATTSNDSLATSVPEPKSTVEAALMAVPSTLTGTSRARTRVRTTTTSPASRTLSPVLVMVPNAYVAVSVVVAEAAAPRLSAEPEIEAPSAATSVWTISTRPAARPKSTETVSGIVPSDSTTVVLTSAVSPTARSQLVMSCCESPVSVRDVDNVAIRASVGETTDSTAESTAS